MDPFNTSCAAVVKDWSFLLQGPVKDPSTRQALKAKTTLYWVYNKGETVVGTGVGVGDAVGTGMSVSAVVGTAVVISAVFGPRDRKSVV